MTSVKVVDGKHCPKCGVDIGVWPVFSAVWPTLIWCPNCKTRLRYRRVVLVGSILCLIAVILAAGIGAAVLTLGRSLPGAYPLITWVGGLLLAWVPVELACVWFLRNHRELDLAVP